MPFFKQISIRLKEELSKVLESRADKNNRSMNGEITEILEQVLLQNNSSGAIDAEFLRSIADKIEFPASVLTKQEPENEKYLDENEKKLITLYKNLEIQEKQLLIKSLPEIMSLLKKIH